MRDPKTIVAVLAADHVVQRREGDSPNSALRPASSRPPAGEIVTFGVTPDHPATGYGYIHPGEPLSIDPQVRRVERFVEKPSEERARRLHRERLSVELGQFRVSRGRDARRARAFRAGGGCGGEFRRLRWRARISASSFLTANPLPRRRRSRSIMPSWSEPKEPRFWPLTSAGRMSATWSTVWRLSPRDANGNSLRGRGGGDRFFERAGAVGRTSGRRHRPRQYHRCVDRRRCPCRSPVRRRTRSSSWSNN